MSTIKKIQLLLMLGLIFVLAGILFTQKMTTASIIDTDLIAYWNFDEVPGWKFRTNQVMILTVILAMRFRV